MKKNIYKEKIIKLLEKNHLLSIAEIHKKIKGADYSTIYRNVEQLIFEERIKKVVLDKDNIVYEMNGEKSQHDHFFCNKCGSIDEVEKMSKNFKYLKDCTITEVLFRGLCQKCH